MNHKESTDPKADDLADMPNSASVMASLSRLQHYVEMRRVQPLRGIDPEAIHTIHRGGAFEASVNLSDVTVVCAALAAMLDKPNP